MTKLFLPYEKGKREKEVKNKNVGTLMSGRKHRGLIIEG
jgi:hypothetical protein